MAKPKKAGGPKQKLSPEGRARKAARDLAYAKGEPWEGKSTAKFKRADKKAHNQREENKCPKGYDFDHNTNKCVKSGYNRGGTQSKKKKDGTKAENTQN